MSTISAGPAALAALFIFIVPGFTFLALLARDDLDALEWEERPFLIVAISVALSAWVALVLSEIGRFSLPRAGAVLAILCVAALLAGWRRLRWPLKRPRGVPSLLALVSLLAVTFFFQARPGEYLLGGRDPGTYIATMAMIARTGAIEYTDPIVQSIPPEDVELFFRNPQAPDFTWARFMGFPLERPATARVFPEFFHLFPAFGAYLFQAMGIKGALATPPLFGILGTLAVYFAGRRLLGMAVAWLGTLLLGLNVIQVWFARTPVSEPVSQFLIFLGLLAFALWEERGASPFGVLAGGALGLSLLVRVDSALILVPMAAYVLLRRARHKLSWRQGAPLLVPFVLLLGHAGLHGLFWSRKYLLAITSRPYWQQPTWLWMASPAALLFIAFMVPRLSTRMRRLSVPPERVRTTVAAGLVLLALYAYFLRPYLSAWAGADGNDPARTFIHRGWLQALGFSRLAAHDAQSLVRLGWFVTPLALALALGGLVLLIRKGHGRLLFPLALFLSYAFFYLYKLRVWNDYYFALRRFVPVVLPFLMLFAATALVRLARKGTLACLAALTACAVLVGVYVRETRPLIGYVDWAGSVAFVRDVARRFGPADIVIFEQPQSLHPLSLPLWAVYGVGVIELARFNPDPQRLAHLVESWRRRYRNIYFVHTYRTNLCGLFLQRVEEYPFVTREWERAYASKPRGPELRSLRFTVSRVVPPRELSVPALPEVDVGGSDDFQVSGFYDKEGDLAHGTYRWTGPCGSLYMPGLVPGARLVITASAERRPAERPALVRVSVDGTDLGGFVVGDRWRDYEMGLPATLGGPHVVRFDVIDSATGRSSTWRPANVDPHSSDTRDLGVMIARVRIETVAANANAKMRDSRSAGGGR